MCLTAAGNWISATHVIVTALIQSKTTVSWRYIMTSSNGNSFRITGHLCGEFTGHRWIPLTKASDPELWCFLWSAPEINGWVNNREAGDLRSHSAQYDVTVMGYSNKYMIGYPHLLRSVVNFNTIRSNHFLEMEIQSLWQTLCPVVMLSTSGAASHEHFCNQYVVISSLRVVMMTSWNGSIFCVTGPLCGEFTSDAELWCILWSAPWINGWVYNREAGDLRRQRDHDDVTVMDEDFVNSFVTGWF